MNAGSAGFSRTSERPKPRHRTTLTRGDDYEYLDNFVHHSVDRMARRFHGVPRGRRIDSLVAALRRDLADTPLRPRKKSRLTRVSH